MTDNEGAATRQKILDFVYHPQYQPTKPKGIHQALRLPPEQYPDVRKAVKNLVMSGQLAYGGNHLVVTPELVSGDPKLLRGTFRQAAAGFGFVRPVMTGRLATTEDIFIPAAATSSAMDGDLVQIRIRPSRRGSGTEGEVIEVIERARRQFAGTFGEKDGQAIVWLDGVAIGTPVWSAMFAAFPFNPAIKWLSKSFATHKVLFQAKP